MKRSAMCLILLIMLHLSFVDYKSFSNQRRSLTERLSYCSSYTSTLSIRMIYPRVVNLTDRGQLNILLFLTRTIARISSSHPFSSSQICVQPYDPVAKAAWATPPGSLAGSRGISGGLRPTLSTRRRQRPQRRTGLVSCALW